MKFFVFTFFFGLSITALPANSTPYFSITTMKNIDVQMKELNQINQNTLEKAVAFECYYTVEWLYRESPFIEKLEALV